MFHISFIPSSIFSYVRVRRNNQSFFIMCSPSQTALYIKEQVAMCLDRTSEAASSLQIQTKEGTVMEDDDSLDQLRNEDELYVCLPIADGEWEAVDIVLTETAMAE
jgi:hypothetical protein